LVLTAAAIAAAVGWATTRDNPAGVNLSVKPRTIFVTIPFNVGDTYALGEGLVPVEVPRPVLITAITIPHMRGLDVLGVGAYEPNPDSIGLVPGWPPEGRYAKDVKPLATEQSWPGEVHTVVGLRITEAKSGLRGIDVRWVDGAGKAGGRTFDLAVLTCAPGACEVDSATADPMLKELGLLR
jgi:hypothetical protein